MLGEILIMEHLYGRTADVAVQRSVKLAVGVNDM